MWKVDLPASRVGKRQRIYRDSEQAALIAAREAINEHHKFGGALKKITLEERSLLHDWRGKLTVAEMREALEEWYERRGKKRTIKEAVAEFITAPRDTPVSKRHADDLRLRLKHFAERHSDRTLISITAGEIETYINSQGGSAPNYFRVLRQFMNYADRHEWITTNPMRKVPRPEPPSRIKDILTPTQMHKALRICAGGETGVLVNSDPTGPKPILGIYPPLLCELIFGGLCGMRVSEVNRLQWEDIDLGAGELGEIHVREMKTARRGTPERYIALSPMVRAWIDWLPGEKKGRVVAANRKNLDTHWERLLEALRLKEWPHNALRRSYGSYHLAAYENAAQTAELMGHTDARTTKAKYRVARRKEVALQWFALTPTYVLSTPAPTPGEADTSSCRSPQAPPAAAHTRAPAPPSHPASRHSAAPADAPA